MKKGIKEMEHIEAQEHINSCPECLKEYKKEMKDTYEKGKEDGRQEEREKLLEAVEKTIRLRLDYCKRQNGLPYCKNCGLCKEDLEEIKKEL